MRSLPLRSPPPARPPAPPGAPPSSFAPLGGQIALKQNLRRQFIHSPSPLFDPNSALSQHPLRLDSGQPLGPEAHFQPGARMQALAEIAGVLGLPPLTPAHVQRMAHHNEPDFMFRGDFRKRG